MAPLMFLLLFATGITQVAAAIAPFRLDHFPQEYNHSAVNNLTPRSFEVLTHGGRKPWPIRNPRARPRVRTVLYCYANQYSRNELYHDVQSAITLWMNALGGPPSANTRHNLVFQEFTNNAGQPVYCFTNYQNQVWNPAVPTDLLAIHWWQNTHAMSTVGYEESPTGMAYRTNRHTMYLPSRRSNVYPTIFAHELGHILGLLHEHQRPDRDQFVQYRPHLVQGFEAAVASGRASTGCTRQRVIQALTDDGAFCAQHWELGANFVKNPEAGAMPNMLSPYDSLSIMHYDSRMGATNIAAIEQGNMNTAPLVTRQGGVVYSNMHVSARDADFVRQFYPWIG